MSYLAEIENLKNGTFEFKKVKLSLPKDAMEDLKFILDNGVTHEEFMLLALKKINLKSFRKEVERVMSKRERQQIPEKKAGLADSDVSKKSALGDSYRESAS